MIKQCDVCGYVWNNDEGETNVCQECGEETEITEYYDENEIVEKLNDLQYVVNKLKIVRENGYVRIDSIYGKVKKGEYPKGFVKMCKIIPQMANDITNKQFYVLNNETKEKVFIGTDYECKQYVSNNETMWNELVIKEYKK